MIDLKIAWATHKAAKFACENFHYSKCLLAGKLVKIGTWEDGKFIGVVIFSRGANGRIDLCKSIG
ncbi:Mom family adenine methylcarbamoylation protein [Bacillus haynesii]